MTCGSRQEELSVPETTTPENAAVEKQTLTRLVSEGALSTMTESFKSSPQYVSGCEAEEGKPITLSERSGSPMRCVSEFDELTTASKEPQDGVGTSTNPLCCARLRSAHVRALRLEADLQPMRMILGRLMAHPMNKKGLFNAPVNALALGLVDYHQIIQKPMDLGTIKMKLYSISYKSKQEVAEDVCLVFQNAMLYNPHRNPVHVAARTLQDFFEELYVAVGGDKKSLPVSVARPPSANAASRRVSFTQVPEVQVVKPVIGNSTGKGGKDIMRTVSCDADALSDRPTASLATTAPPAKTATNSAAPTAVAAPTTETAPKIDAAPTTDVAPMELCATVGHSAPNTSTEGAYLLSSPLLSTRGRGTFASSTPPMEIKHERKRRLSYSGHKRTQGGHSCRSCRGRSCLLCEQSCLPLEPTLLVCNGGNCAGAKIRKGSTYYIACDGSRQYCQRCFTTLPPVLLPTAEDGSVRYRRDLLKRKNDEELVESWFTCSKCEMGVHHMCALHDSLVHPTEGYTCPGCTSSSPAKGMAVKSEQSEMYTFITGSENPLPLSEVSDSSNRLDHEVFSAESLAETDVSAFIQAKVRDRLKSTSRVPNAEKTVIIRIVSDCDRSFKVPDVVRKHFRMATAPGQQEETVVTPPEKINFKSKAIALFQKVDGLDICIFCMYVQEYEGDDDYAADQESSPSTDLKKRVYIAYLDSVEHFRPRTARTSLYHELLVSYLASARMRGFEYAHIWACPPSRGNSFVFWNHPSSQRTPTKERLISWYHSALSRAIDCGVVTDVKSLYESDFQDYVNECEKENQGSGAPLDPSGKLVCPPLFEGDYWIEEAVRIHAASLARHLKAKSPNEGKDLSVICNSPLPGNETCPARLMASLLLDRIMAHPSAAPFRRPVNAAAMKLKDYHKIITNPMDLGTIYSRCIHGEYLRLGDLVEDVQLVFDNAKKFNPEGNFVHTMAVEMEELFFKELDVVTKTWNRRSEEGAVHSWKALSNISMSLDAQLELPAISGTDSESSPPVTTATTDATVEPAPTQDPRGVAATMAAAPSANRAPLSDVSKKSVVAKEVQPPTVQELLTGGPDVLSRRMAGKDKWMLEKRSNLPPKKPSVSKKGNGKRRRSSASITPLPEEEPSSKRRRQTWLGEEVGASVRSMRTSFFACSLVPANSMSEAEQEKASVFSDYAKCYEPSPPGSTAKVIASPIADARSALLEFSQRRNLEFDTLRHAKYSTAVLLYHLHNDEAPGVIPTCTSCKQETLDCRWHKIVKIEELFKPPTKRKRPTKASTPDSAKDKLKYQPEELCPDCHSGHPQKDQFIPLPVSFKSD